MSAPRRISAGAVALLALRALTLGALTLGAPFASTASAQNGGISVKIVNKTEGGGPVGSLPVSVLVVQQGGQEIANQGRTDASGSYVAADITGPAGASYVISTTYEGVAYRTASLSLPAHDVQLAVYETMDDDSKVRIANAGVVLLEVDPETQRLRFLETITLLNDGERTFLPSTTGARGPMGLLRFGLPDGAGNLIVGEGLTESAVIQVDTGFATDMPVPPGETNISYTYEMAYGALGERGYSLVSRNIAYPIDLLQVLTVQGAFRVESPLLTDNGVATVGSRTYRQLRAQNLPAHSEVSFELRDLPLIQPILRPGNAWLQAITASLALLALTLPLLYRRGRAKRRPAMASSSHAPPALMEAQGPAATHTHPIPPPVRHPANRPPPEGEPRS